MRVALYISLFLIAEYAGATTLTVCDSGCNYTTANIQTAVDAAVGGDIIEIANITGVTVSLPNRGDMDNTYAVIRPLTWKDLDGTSRIDLVGEAASLATISAANTALQCEARAHHWRIYGIVFSSTDGGDGNIPFKCFVQVGGGDGANEVSDLAYDIIVDHSAVVCVECRHGFYLSVGKFTLVNSACQGVAAPTGEPHCITAINSTGPMYVRNVLISSTAIGSLAGGAAANINGMRLEHAVFLGNYYFKPYTWRVQSAASDPTYTTCAYEPRFGGEYWSNTSSGNLFQCNSSFVWADLGVMSAPVGYQSKNQQEWKNACHVESRGNYIGPDKYPTFGNQHGAAWLLNQVDGTNNEYATNICDIRITDSYAYRTPICLTNGVLYGSESYHQKMGPVEFVNNICDQIGIEPEQLQKTGGDISKFLQTSNQDGLTVANNTFVTGRATESSSHQMVSMAAPTCDHCTYAGNISNIGGTSSGPYVFNNDNGGGSLWNAFNNPTTPDVWHESQRILGLNVFVNARNCIQYGRSCLTNNLGWPNDDTVTKPADPYFMEAASWAAMGMVDYDAGDYTLNCPTSVYCKRGPEGFDPGAKVSEVLNSVSAVPAGGPNPFLDFIVQSIIAADTTAEMNFTSYDAAACTVEVSNEPTHASPVYSDSITGVQNSRARSASITGLSTAKRWFYLITCNGKTREGTFYTTG